MIQYVSHVSQQSTFLYSPRTRIRSSRPDAWSVQDVIQAGRSVRPPSPGKASAPLHMRVDTSSYASACAVRPSKKPYKRRHIGLSRESQPLTLKLSTTLDLAETSALDYYAWHVVPFAGKNYLVSIGYYLAPEVEAVSS